MMTSKPQSVVPEGTLVYAIGDLHGRLDLLTQLMKLIEKDVARHKDLTKELIFLGDYVDRGVDSKGVIDFLLSGLPPDIKPTFLRGNHDDAMLSFCEGDLSLTGDWLSLGGTATLASYGVNPFSAKANQDHAALREAFLAKIPPEHIAFLKNTQISCSRGDYFFAHAGIKPGVPLDEQTERDRMWIRHEFLASDLDHGKMVIHGHCVVSDPDIQKNRIGIDTGAYATGTLTCLVLEGPSRHFLST